MSNVIVRRTQQEMLLSMAQYLPGGELFEAAYVEGSNLNALLKGLSGVLLDADNFMFLYNSEFIPDETTVFIEEWESALGIPDDCFTISPGDTNEQRRLNILVKLASVGVQTAADFQSLAVILGFEDVQVLSGMDGVDGDELVTNGSFATDTAWTKGTGWSITGGVAVKTPGTASALSQAFTTDPGSTYILNFDLMERTAGELEISLSGGTAVTFTANTSLSEPLVAGSGTGGINIAASADFNGTIDNVSVQGLIDGIVNPRFTIFVIFPFTGNLYPLKYAYTYGTSAFAILECLFAKLKPANCDVKFLT